MSAQLRRRPAKRDLSALGRKWAWFVLLTFLSFSMWANLASARTDWISWLVAVIAPLALLGSSKLIPFLPKSDSRAKNIFNWSLMGLVVLISGYVSYWHMVNLFTKAGETYLSAHILPFAVDVPMIKAGMILSHNGRRATQTRSSVARVVTATKAPAKAVRATQPRQRALKPAGEATTA